jgi:hypothetical protein
LAKAEKDENATMKMRRNVGTWRNGCDTSVTVTVTTTRFTFRVFD